MASSVQAYERAEFSLVAVYICYRREICYFGLSKTASRYIISLKKKMKENVLVL